MRGFTLNSIVKILNLKIVFCKICLEALHIFLELGQV